MATPSNPRSAEVKESLVAEHPEQAGAAIGAPTAGDDRTPAPRESAPPELALPHRTIALGFAGSVLMLITSVGAGSVLVSDPVLGTSALSWIRYGHGRMLATAVLYIGFALVVWAWVRLGRHVLAGRVGSRAVLWAAAAWIAPLIFAPPLFTRDPYSYYAYGTLPLHGYDPYEFGPLVLSLQDIVQNVHPFWQAQPANYGPLFILIAKGVAWLSGGSVLIGVILMRLTMLAGIALLLWSLPGLTRHLGGDRAVTLWLAVAGPMTVVHLVGGPHNDLLMVGLLAAGTLCVLERKHVLGVVLVTLGAAVKVTAVLALPFLVWVWAAHLTSTFWRNFARATACAVAAFVATFAATTFIAGVDLGWLKGLQAPGNIVNWLSLPTAVGEFVHTVTGIFIDGNKSWFVNIARGIGGVIFLVIAARLWWQSRYGGADAVRRMAFALFALAVLSPATLPWYLTWGFAIAAALRWQRRQLAILVSAAVFLVLTYSPAGEDLLYDWAFMAGAVAVSLLAGFSLLRNDPLGLFSDREELVQVPARV